MNRTIIACCVLCALLAGCGKEEDQRVQERQRIQALLDAQRENALAARVRILSTDHTQLLAQCRQMMGADKHVTTNEVDELPETIRDLQPRYVRVYTNSLRIDFSVGCHHQYVWAYPAGHQSGLAAYDDNFETNRFDATVKLIDGLVYYEDYW